MLLKQLKPLGFLLRWQMWLCKRPRIGFIHTPVSRYRSHAKSHPFYMLAALCVCTWPQLQYMRWQEGLSPGKVFFFFLQMENYQLSVFTYTNLCFVKNIIQMLCMETYYMLYFSYKKVQRGGSCMILHSSSNSFWWNTMNLNCITQWSWFWEKTFSKNKYDCLRVCFDALWRSHFKLENLKSCPTFVDACFLWLVYLFCKALFFLVL